MKFLRNYPENFKNFWKISESLTHWLPKQVAHTHINFMLYSSLPGPNPKEKLIILWNVVYYHEVLSLAAIHLLQFLIFAMVQNWTLWSPHLDSSTLVQNLDSSKDFLQKIETSFWLNETTCILTPIEIRLCTFKRFKKMYLLIICLFN